MRDLSFLFFFKCFCQIYCSFLYLSYPEISKLLLDSNDCSIQVTRRLNFCPRIQQEKRKQFWGLTRLDGVKVGYVRRINVVPGVTHTMKTIAVKPLMFEIPNFLTDEQCNYIIEKANNSDMFTSITMASSYKETVNSGYPFHQLDINKDGVITAPELRATATEDYNLYLDDDDILKMFADLNITVFDHDSCYDNNDQCKAWALGGECDKNPSYMLYKCRKSCNNCGCRDKFQNCSNLAAGNNCFDKHAEWMLRDCPDSCNVCVRGISTDNFDAFNTLALKEYLIRIKMENPNHRARYSSQAWLYKKKDPILNNIFEREVKLTGLPRDILEGAEAFQVVRYGKRGHYHAHYDSSETSSHTGNITCCHQAGNETKSCQLCRFLTILYYLNDVTKGGETAFPIANNETLSTKELKERKNSYRFNLSKFCHHANVVLKPKRGTAVIWYNHFLDDENTWLGPFDPYSLHGGCDIHEGEKWIINHWITAPYKDSAHVKSIYDVR